MIVDKKYVVIGILVLLIFLTSEKETINIVQGQWDISEQVVGFEEYLKEEPDFDYSYPAIWSTAQEIKSTTSSPDEAVKKTIRMVAQNTRYSSKITVQYCYDEKASTVIDSGIGDCVSMSRLVTSLLRAQGIPARTSGGCLSFSKRCTILFSTIPYLEPQVTDMVEGDFKKRGYLHEWVEVYTPNQGWFIVEATSGQTYPLECNTYLQHSYDSNQYNRCVISDSSFWRQCSNY